MPSTMGRMSRCTPSRETSGPWPPSRPAILSISSMKMMPEVCTRSTASARHLLGVDQARLLLLQQDARAPRGRAAGGACVRPPKRPGSRSFTLTSISSTPCEERIWKDGEALLAHLDLDRAARRAARRAAARAASRAWRASCSRRGARALAGVARRAPWRAAGGRSRSRSCSSTLRSRLAAHLRLLLAAHHVHRRLGEVAHHRLHVAAHVADLGELGGLDLQEGAAARGGPGGARSRSCPRRWARS